MAATQETTTAVSAPPTIPAATEIATVIAQLEGRLQEKVKEDKVMLLTLRNALKKHDKELKHAHKKKRSAPTTEDGEKAAKQRKPSDPVVAKQALADFLGVAVGSSVDMAEARATISAYINEHKLKDSQNGKLFNPDEKLSKLLGEARYIYAGDKKGFSFLNMGRYIQDTVEKVAQPAETV